jgi:DNA-binding NtrC family response regulator
MLSSTRLQAMRDGQDPSETTLTDTDQRRGATETPGVVAPHLFVALDCDHPEAGASRHSLANIDRVLLARGPARRFERSFDGSERVLTIRIPDPRASSRHATLERNGATFALRDLDSRNGTRLNGSPVTALTALDDGDLVQLGHTILLYREAISFPLEEPADADSTSHKASTPLATILPSLARKASSLERVGRSATPVLILGETGAGKEVLARAIHRISERKGEFVAVNCGALPAPLVEGQLFGHVRGAFSGAVGSAPGLIRSADAGTLLLDEIGDLPQPAQAALLRALQEQEVVALGDVRPVKVDFRLVAATNRPLDDLVTNGEFRRDLFARLTGFTFLLPPLRDRREDIGLLLATFAAERKLRLTPAAGCCLLAYDWPLNVRELRKAIDVSATIAGGEAIDVVHLPPEIVAHTQSASPRDRAPTPADPLRERLLASLARHEGNVSGVAREFGKARMQIQRWIRRFGVDPRSFHRGK